MKRLSRLLLLVGSLSVTAVATRATEVTIFAAASLSDALSEIARTYEAGSGDKLRFNFGASSTLARQIREGAPADVFFSADEAKMNALAAAGLIDVPTRIALLSNTLVIVVPQNTSTMISGPGALAGVGVRRLALAETQTVPAGIYARDYLQAIGLWSKVQPKVIPTENVRTALAAVEAGNADAAIVYKTDALQSRHVKIAFEVPSGQGPRIVYPVAVILTSRRTAAARALVGFLAGSEAHAVFMKYGFLPLAAAR